MVQVLTLGLEPKLAMARSKQEAAGEDMGREGRIRRRIRDGWAELEVVEVVRMEEETMVKGFPSEQRSKDSM